MSQENPFAKLPNTPTPRPSYFKTIDVLVQTQIIDEWSKAEYRELEMIKPGLCRSLTLMEEDIINYNRFLLYQRVKSVAGDCKIWHRLKSLYITATIQMAISTVGVVDLYNIGRKFVPVVDWEPEITIDEAEDISFSLSRFQDIVIMAQDAMPRGSEGDEHVMQMAVIAGNVEAAFEGNDNVAAYLAHFLHLKVVEEEMWRVIYTQTYDNIDFTLSAYLRDLNMLSIREGALSWLK
jgi:hypothetical protein